MHILAFTDHPISPSHKCNILCTHQGKEFETRLKEKKPGDLSDELRRALGMPIGTVRDNAQLIPREPSLLMRMTICIVSSPRARANSLLHGWLLCSATALLPPTLT